MALIEGVGDEVTVLFGIVFCFLVLVLAWISTHTAERGEQIFVSVVSTSTARPGGTQRLPEVPTEPVIEPAGIEEPKNEREEDTTKLPAPSNGTEPGLPDAVDATSGTLRHRVRAAIPDASSNTLDCSENTHPSEELSGQAEERVGVAEESMENATADPTMVIRLKFLNDTERLARMRPGDTVSILKRTYFPGQEHQVRLIYQGQLLRDDSQTMSSLHLTDNCVLHCHISQHATPQMPAGTRVADQVNTALNIGSLMVPLFVLMLSLLWYFQIQYRQFFTATATVCLAGVTILFSLMAFTMYRR